MTAVGAYAKKVPVAHAVVAAAELVANAISVAERIDDVMPVGSLEDERLAVFKLPIPFNIFNVWSFLLLLRLTF